MIDAPDCDCNWHEMSRMDSSISQEEVDVNRFALGIGAAHRLGHDILPRGYNRNKELRITRMNPETGTRCLLKYH